MQIRSLGYRVSGSVRLRFLGAETKRDSAEMGFVLKFVLGVARIVFCYNLFAGLKQSTTRGRWYKLYGTTQGAPEIPLLVFVQGFGDSEGVARNLRFRMHVLQASRGLLLVVP